MAASVAGSGRASSTIFGPVPCPAPSLPALRSWRRAAAAYPNVAEYGCASLPRAAGSLRGAIAEPIEDALPRVHAPALVIRGNEDRLSSLEWAERLAGLAPAGELAQLPGLGHDAFYRAPDVVAAVAAPFLTAGAGEPAPRSAGDIGTGMVGGQPW